MRTGERRKRCVCIFVMKENWRGIAVGMQWGVITAEVSGMGGWQEGQRGVDRWWALGSRGVEEVGETGSRAGKREVNQCTAGGGR